MKVLKFGGSSLGTADSIFKVKSIIDSAKGQAIVVVAALEGVTDQLIKASTLAASGDASFSDVLAGIRKMHCSIFEETVCDNPKKADIKQEIENILQRMEKICEGIFTLRVLPEESAWEIESFGERLSANILAGALPGAVLADSPSFIKTKKTEGTHNVDIEMSNNLIKCAFKKPIETTVIVPGFIGSDSKTGVITTLGRGGSDYTASLIAASLGAESLEIWTDVDGFTTADPTAVKTAYVIEELTYREAMELCNFGVKTLYSPALFPVHSKGIPVVVKNTFNPEGKGTTISNKCTASKRTIRGVSSIDDICLLTLSGTSLAGLVGVDSRLFSTLANESISAFFVCQSASETGISVGLKRSNALRAKEALDEAFKAEIEAGVLSPMRLDKDLAAVAAIGENMKNCPGIAGKLFSTLGRNGINIIACTQDASESNISFVIERTQLHKALNVIHDSFFLSEYQELNLFICGIGTVGGQLLEQIEHQREKLMKERNLKINVVGIARSVKGVFNREGIDLSHYKEALENGIALDPAKLKEEIIGMNIFNSVFVDCTASADVAGLYEDFFNHGISVVAANKIAASSAFENYTKLKEAARSRNVKYLFETNVGAGLPIIGTINDLRNSGDRILKLEAVLSGTLNFIFNTISSEIPFSKAVMMAKEQGFSEPDPRIDLSGKDVIRKLVILSREAGYKVSQEDVKANLFIPADFFDCSIEEFWKKLPSLDESFETRRQKLEAEHKRWRFVAKMENGECSVSLKEIEIQHSFYVLDGSNNIILLTTERYNKHPMLIQGYGAGASVTAAGVFADIMSVANIR